MVNVNSNTFNVIINRDSSSNFVNSNTFTTVVNKNDGVSELGVNGKANTQVILYKNGVKLIPVSSSPKDGEFKISIDSTKGCTANIKNNDTVYIDTLTEYAGTVVINITVSNGKVFKKYFTVQKNISLSSIQDIETRVTNAEHKVTNEAIVSTVTSSTSWRDQSNSISNAQNIANIANSTANNANSTANNAQNAANTNKNNILNLINRVNSAELKITSEAIVSTVTSSSTYKDALTGKVDTNKVISSINQTAEAIKINANKIQLEGAVSVSNTNGNSVKINNADYEVRNGSTTKAFFGLRTLDDSREIPRFAMGSNGLDVSSNNYFVTTAYPSNNNPLNTPQSYIDMAYRTHNYWTNDTSGDVSNIRMLDDGDIHIAPVRNLLIKSSFEGGGHNNSSDEQTIAKFGTSSISEYEGYLEVDCVKRIGNGKGIMLQHFNSTGDGTSVRLCCDNEGYKFFAPAYDGKDVSLGSTGYLWSRVCAVNGTINTSDRRLKDNIKYIQETPNPKTVKSEEYSLQDMYDFVKDDLSMTTYTMKDDKEQKLKYGFIAQDIVDTKVGYNIVSQDNEGDFLGYDTMNYTSAIAGALKQAINEIEKLKEEIEKLKANK